ncbi:M48 family metallopeptidase [Phenylobacterium sp.]|uniref:M48 family metallopeptidase n=1 Tax=Phenylobacterium sp. TaxID=1871053 RepID=UPI002F4125F7
MHAVGLKTYIWNNNLRSAFLLAGFPVLLVGIVFALELLMLGAGLLPSTGSAAGDAAFAARLLAASAPISILVALAWFVVAYFANTGIIAMATRSQPVSRAEEPALYNLLENLAISRGLRTPRLQVIEQPAMNAFASGMNQDQYTITVTRGLLDALTPQELEAVLAHELTHVINRDVRTMVIASVFAGIISLVAQIIYRSVMWGSGDGRRRDRRGGGMLFVLVALAIAAVGYVLALVIRMALSRSREFVADAGSVELTKNPDAMISALQKIAGRSDLPVPEAVQGMFVENVETGVMSLFATHPPISARIAALQQYAGGRVSQAPPPAVAGAVVEAGPWGAPADTPEAPQAGPWG